MGHIMVTTYIVTTHTKTTMKADRQRVNARKDI